MEGANLIGLDTNVLIRFVMEDDHVQVEQAQSLLDTLTTRDPGYISLVVLCELAWVLGRFYNRTRPEVASAVEHVLSASNLHVERASIARNALQQFRVSRADFGDCCICAIADSAGCEYTVTFDKAAARLPGMRLLGAPSA